MGKSFFDSAHTMQSPSQLPAVPTLENGDRLSGPEFERRYAAMPDLRKAELIEGVVHLPPAALRFKSHGQPHSYLTTWLGVYQALTPGTSSAIEPTTRLDRQNYPQPDAVLMIDHSRGGQARLSQDDYVQGAPELAVEISASSVSIDLGRKKAAYCRCGIKEYIVWRVFDRALDWFHLQTRADGSRAYAKLPVDAANVIKSPTFPGLWLPPEALLSGNMAQVLAQLQIGLTTNEHTAFVAQLNRNA